MLTNKTKEGQMRMCMKVTRSLQVLQPRRGVGLPQLLQFVHLLRGDGPRAEELLLTGGLDKPMRVVCCGLHGACRSCVLRAILKFIVLTDVCCVYQGKKVRSSIKGSHCFGSQFISFMAP
jgi:hypothetical protein